MRQTSMKVQLGKYRHYRTQKVYEVLGQAIHSETYEDMVIYQALYDCEQFGPNRIWVRPATMFFEMVVVENESKPRFEYLGFDKK
jgi:hypothetical protein